MITMTFSDEDATFLIDHLTQQAAHLMTSALVVTETQATYQLAVDLGHLQALLAQFERARTSLRSGHGADRSY